MKKTVQRAAPDVQVLTLDEAAIELRVCRKTLETFILRKELRPTRLGRRVLLTRAELAKFISKRTG